MKLLLAKIEAVCTDGGGAGPSSGDGAAPNFVPQLFRGQTSRSVTCATCGTSSDSSKSRVDYYELEVYVRGHKALGAALADLLAPEHLTGDNAYACASLACAGTKQSASLATRVHAPPPPVLNINLKRFVFDAKTCSRKKVTDRFAFPAELDLAPFLTYDDDVAASRGTAVVYDLTAVLLHKGQSASHGHYIALVRVAGTWWRFDDEDVVKLGQHPLGDTDDKKAAAEARKEKKKGGAKKGGTGGKKDAPAAAAAGAAVGGDAAPQKGKGGTKRTRGAEAPKGSIEAAFAAVTTTRSRGAVEPLLAPVPAPADDDIIFTEVASEPHPEAAAQAPGGGGGAAGDIPPGHYASTEAYLLIYEARRPATGAAHAPLKADAVPEVPQNVLAAVAAADAELEKRLTAATAKREEARQEIVARKALVTDLLPVAGVPVNGDGADEYHWISAAWLGAWASDETPPGPIDNGCIMCPHGRLDPVKARTGAKRISKTAWEVLSSSYGLTDGCPQLPGGPDAMCLQCAAEAARLELSGRARADARAVLRGELEAVMKRQEPGTEAPAAAAGDASDVWVSRAWCTSWLKWQPDAAAAPPPPAAEAAAAALSPEVIIINDNTPAQPAAAPRKPVGVAVMALLRGLAGGPATALQCPHSGLLPDDSAVSRRVRVSAALWTQLCAEAQAAAAALKRGGGGEVAAGGEGAIFPQFNAVTTSHCAQCDADAVAKDKAVRQLERQKLAALAKGSPTAVVPDGPYLVAIPAAFLRAWRAYVLPAASGTAGLVACPRPRGDDPAYTWPRCEPHDAPLVMLPPLIHSTKAGKPWEAPLRVAGVDDDAAASGKEASDMARALTASLAEAGGGGGGMHSSNSVMPLLLISHQDGVTLGELYGAVSDGHGNQVVSCGAVVRVTAPHADAGPDAPPTLHCHPVAPCQDCCAVATAAAAAAACSYRSGSVSVTLQKPPRHMAASGGGESPGRGFASDDDYEAAPGTRGASKRRKVEETAADGGGSKPTEGISQVQDPKVAAAAAAALRASAAAAGSTLPLAGVRASKRVRAGTAGGSGGTSKRNVSPISSDDSVWQLKLRILEMFQVHPFDQMLFCAGRRVDKGTAEGDKELTLGAAGIPTGASLFLVSAGHHDADDVAGLLGDDVVPGFRRGAVEKGFLGTGLLLHGHTDDPGIRIIDPPEDDRVIVVN